MINEAKKSTNDDIRTSVLVNISQKPTADLLRGLLVAFSGSWKSIRVTIRVGPI